MTCLSRYLSQIWIFWSRNFQSSSVIHHLYFNNKEVGNKSEKKVWKISEKNFWNLFFCYLLFQNHEFARNSWNWCLKKIMNLRGSWIVKGESVLCEGIWNGNLQFCPKWLSEGLYRIKKSCPIRWNAQNDS